MAGDGTRRPRIAVAHPKLAGGGSESRAMWALQALQEEYEPVLLTGAPVDWERLNGSYGTRVDGAKVRVCVAPIPSVLQSGAGDAIRGALFQRFCRKIGPELDLCISTYNFVDFGRPAMQFVADFSWSEALRQMNDAPPHGARGLFHRPTPLRSGYLRLVDHLAGGKAVLLRDEDKILANSTFSAGLLLQHHGISAAVVYPPIPPLAESKSPPASRTNDFVALGRIEPEKRLEDAIEIMARVRRAGFKANLHIIGRVPETPYGRRLRGLAREAGEWVVLHGSVYGAEKAALLRTCGFGIHTRIGEAFGIAVAEMVHAGVVPFVRATGAPSEIVGERELCFDSPSEAVERIVATLTSAERQASLRAKLRERGKHFSAERFQSELLRLVESGLSNQRAPS